MGEEKQSVREKFTAWQRAALAHSFDVDRDKHTDPACMHVPGKGYRVILTCDIDEETCQAYGGPVWHVSVWPSNRRRAEALLSCIGEGAFFEEPGVARSRAYAPADDNRSNEAVRG